MSSSCTFSAEQSCFSPYVYCGLKASRLPPAVVNHLAVALSFSLIYFHFSVSLHRLRDLISAQDLGFLFFFSLFPQHFHRLFTKVSHLQLQYLIPYPDDQVSGNRWVFQRLQTILLHRLCWKYTRISQLFVFLFFSKNHNSLAKFCFLSSARQWMTNILQECLKQKCSNTLYLLIQH